MHGLLVSHIQVMRWLRHGGTDNVPILQHTRVKRLHRGPPIFGGGGMSTVAVATVLAAHTGTTTAMIWVTSECLLMGCWGVFVWRSRRHVDIRGALPSRALPAIELLGALSIGFGTLTSILSGNSLAMAVGWMSAVAFAGEACIINLGSPRLLAAMLSVGAAPAVVACLMTRDPALIVVAMLISVYLGCLLLASAQVNTLLVTTIRAERENDHRARHDQLTGLLNRAGLEREVALIRSEYPKSELLVYFVDLDRFKQINDRFGHAVGDQVLRLVSEKLLELCAPDDVVARIGGDEFIVVASLALVRPDEFGAAVLDAVNAVNHKIALNGSSVSASVGIARSSAGGASLAALLATADKALYRAKHLGGGQCVEDDIEPPS